VSSTHRRCSLGVKPSFVSKWHLVDRTFYWERKPLSDQVDLEKKTIEALQHYRKALATVESREQAEASAQRTLTGMLPDLERAILEDCSPSVKDNLVQTGMAAVSRSNEACDALSKATTTLEVARQALVALEQQLGYIPGVSKVSANSRSIRHSPNCG
jgi:DNA repair ATPase RecN